MNVIEFLNTPALLGDAFAGESHEAFRSVLCGAFAVPMDNDRLALFSELAGGREPPSNRVRELFVIAGRRSEKTKTAAAVALFLATVYAELEGLVTKLSRGERAVVAVLAVDRAQAKLAFGYIQGMVEQSPVLSQMVKKQDAAAIHFNNRISVEIHTNSFRAIRGRTLLAVLMDECAFYRSESVANPDIETYRAALPGLATLNGMLIGVSSPYAKRGLLYQKYRDHYGQDSDVLVVQGSTQLFNPTIDHAVIEAALKEDPEAAQSEWLGEFRSDLEAFISREVIEALVRASPVEIPYSNKHHYFAFTDPAGGGQDEFTIAIGHMEGDVVVVDLVRGQKGTPSVIVGEYSQLLKDYRVFEVYGDRYGGSWPSDEYKKHGIRYVTSEKPKSDLYVDVLPLINSGRIELPPVQKLINQFSNLERRTSRNGKYSIDHGPGGHDDLSNAVAGLGTFCKRPPRTVTFTSLKL